MDNDGNNKVNLTNSTGMDDNAVISPDGSKVVFRSSRDNISGLYIMNVDGSDVTFLTPGTGPSFNPTEW
jgi:Tol biopolymer transport system component